MKKLNKYLVSFLIMILSQLLLADLKNNGASADISEQSNIEKSDSLDNTEKIKVIQDSIFFDRILAIEKFKSPEFKVDPTKIQNKNLEEAKLEIRKMIRDYITLYEKQLLAKIKLDKEFSPFNPLFVEIRLSEALNKVESVEMLLDPENSKNVQKHLDEMVLGLNYYGLKFYGYVPDLKDETIKQRSEINLLTDKIGLLKSTIENANKPPQIDKFSAFTGNPIVQLIIISLVLINLFMNIYLVIKK